MRTLVALIALSLSVAPAAYAQTYVGPGGMSCKAYMTESEVSTKNMLNGYILGYISGSSFVLSLTRGTDLLKEIETQTILQGIHGYCGENINKTLLNASNAAVQTLIKLQEGPRSRGR